MYIYDTDIVIMLIVNRVLLERPVWRHEQLILSMINVELRDVLDYAASHLMDGLNVVCLVDGTTRNEMVCDSS